MGKQAKRERRSLSGVQDALDLVRLAGRVADYAYLKPRVSAGNDLFRQSGGTARAALDIWRSQRVILRCDADFADALLGCDRDTQVPVEVSRRFPFDVAMVSFTPFDIDDGWQVCRYSGMIIIGFSREKIEDFPPDERPLHVFGDEWERLGMVRTTYGPVGSNDMTRFLWLMSSLHDDGNHQPGLHTITLQHLESGETVAEMVDRMSEMRTGREVPPADAGLYKRSSADLAVLVPLSISLLMYLGSSEPDLDRPIVLGGDGGGTLGPNLTGARIYDMGFRVGRAVRDYTREPSRSGPGRTFLPTGRKLPPHIRSAHWHRFRVATRDAEGKIIGSRSGEKDVDWHYDLKWIPPTPVNVGDEGPQPVVRDIR